MAQLTEMATAFEASKKRKKMHQTYSRKNNGGAGGSREELHQRGRNDDDDDDDEEDDQSEGEGPEHNGRGSSGIQRGVGVGSGIGGRGAAAGKSATGNRVVAGLDFGSAFSAMVITTARGEVIPIGGYPGTPFSYAGRAEDICEVPTIVVLQKGAASVKYSCGWQASQIKTSGTLRYPNIKALLAGDATEVKPLIERLDRMNRSLVKPVTPDNILTEYLKFLRNHLVEKCKVLGQEIPQMVIATHPICWSPQAIIRYSDLLHAAGWQEVETVTEAEAAADVVLADMPDDFFEEGGTLLSVVDLGGMTHDRVFYSVRKVAGVIIKEEIIKPVGGFGGMALLDEAARDLIEADIPGITSEQAEQLCTTFYLAKMQYDPQKPGGLVMREGSLKYTLHANTMANLFDVALQPIIDTTKELRPKMKACNIRKVFLVGGTSASTWLRPALQEAFGEDVQLVFPSQSMSTMMARGAILAWSVDHITSSRFSHFHLGHLVSRSYCPEFADASVWGDVKENSTGASMIEGIELFKMKGEVIGDEKSAEWRWLELPDSSDLNFEATLSNTYVQVFASEADELTIISSPTTYDFAPEREFGLTIEQRHVFNEVDIQSLEVTAGDRKSSLPMLYAVRFVNDGIGLQIQVVWTPLLRRVSNKTLAGLKVKSLGRVKFIINERE